MKRLFFIKAFVLFNFVVFPQKLKFPEQKSLSWSDNKIQWQNIPDTLKREDVVVMRDEFSLVNGFLTRRLALKVQTKNGISKASNFRLPEEMDLINFDNGSKLGRFKNQKTPFCYTYEVKYFGVRIIRPNNQILEVDVSSDNSEVFWIKRDGSHIEQQVFDFNWEEVDINDIVEIAYKVEIGWSKLFMSLNSNYPRLYLSVITNASIGFHNLRPQDTLQFKKVTKKDGKFYFEFKDLKAVYYPENAGALKRMPYLVFNEIRIPWMFYMDSISKKKYNTKDQNSLREYAGNFKRVQDDSSGNKVVAIIVDSLNNLEYISAESIHYSGESQYALHSSEHLLKGRLMEEFVIKTYDRLLEEKKIFFYFGVIGDKRKSEITDQYYSNTIYSESIFAIPQGKNLVFYKTRKDGLKYLPNELPFYLENSKCALIPQNVQFSNDKSIASKMGFTKTPKSTYNENVRNEAGRFQVKIDSMKTEMNIKESLSGQFSTLLRHFYNNEYIDSTVQPIYYKKCTDKPFAKSVKIKNASSVKAFPFKNTFNCSGNILLTGRTNIDFNNWFSFLFSGNQITRAPNHDYYLDFQFTDSYNYLFEFDKAIEVLNSDDFAKKLSNEYFEISCNLVKQESNKYLLSVIVKVKQDVVLEKDASKLIEFVDMLDAINQLKLNFKTI